MIDFKPNYILFQCKFIAYTWWGRCIYNDESACLMVKVHVWWCNSKCDGEVHARSGNSACACVITTVHMWYWQCIYYGKIVSDMVRGVFVGVGVSMMECVHIYDAESSCESVRVCIMVKAHVR